MSKKEGGSLLPIKDEDRIMDRPSLTMLWIGGAINLGIFAVGAGQLERGLNMKQILIVLFISQVLKMLCRHSNDEFSYKSGAPYVIHIKASFGHKGSIIPVIARTLPGIVWYGYQSWLAAAAMNQISIALFNFDNDFVWFFVLQILQCWLSIIGFQGIKWVENIGAVSLILVIAYMLWNCLVNYRGAVNALWEAPPTHVSMMVVATVTLFGEGILPTVGVGDIMREAKPGYNFWQRFGTSAPCIFLTLLLGLIGFMSFGATGEANPINAYSKMVDNKPILVMSLVFILLAQVTTNITNNIVPGVYGCMDLLKMKHKTACIVTGILGCCTCPWILTSDSSAVGLSNFINIYTVMMNPILAVMLVEHFILRRRKISKEFLDDLYDPKGSRSGASTPAVVAFVVCTLLGFINVGYSSVFCIPIAAAIYYVLMTKLPNDSPFRKFTVLESK